MAKQLLGKEVTAALNERIKGNVAALQEKGVNPTLCIIRVGENPSDISYEKGATKRCETLGVACEKILLPEDVAQEELLTVIDKVNKDDHIHGVLLFRPLPKHLDQAVIENALAPEKDVDCMTDLSMSGVFTGKKIGFPPCTPQACMEILDHYGIIIHRECCHLCLLYRLLQEVLPGKHLPEVRFSHMQRLKFRSVLLLLFHRRYRLGFHQHG